MKKRIYILFLFLLPLQAIALELGFLSDYPFQIGEELYFKVKTAGVYAAQQTITIDEFISYGGETLVKGSAQVTTVGAAAGFYELNDREFTYFNPSTLFPVYCEKNILEGDWTDYMTYSFGSDSISIYSDNYTGGKTVSVSSPSSSHNIYTLILALRALDYSSVLNTGRTFTVSYLDDLAVKSIEMTAESGRRKFGGEWVDTIKLESEERKGAECVLSADSLRLPLEVVFPSEKNALTFTAVLESYSSGTTSIQD